MTKTLKRLIASVTFGLMLMSGVALAHPNHKVMGTVTMIAADHVMLKDKAGKEHTIKLAKTTKVTRNKKAMKADKSQMTHKAVGVVRKVDAKAGTVTIDHEPVKSMNWPKMAMTFQVKDKTMLEKTPEGKKVEFEFEARGKDHVITSLK